MSAAYGGSLRAYLLRPPSPSPVNSLSQVVSSGLPWEMVLYGAEAEDFMARQTEEPIRTIWKDKVEVPYEAVAFQRVRRRRTGDDGGHGIRHR